MWNKQQIDSFISGFLSVFSFSITRKNYEKQKHYARPLEKGAKMDRSLFRYFFKAQNYVKLANQIIIRDKGHIKDERNKKFF